MAYEDPYFGTLAEDETLVSTNEFPPEAPASKSNIGVTMIVVATGLIAIGAIIGWAFGRSGNSDS